MYKFTYYHAGTIEVPINEEGLNIGRRFRFAPYFQVPRHCKQTSCEHARLYLRDNKCFVKDLGSTNGTFVNGQRIEENTSLHDGDVIVFGKDRRVSFRITIKEVG